MTKYKSLYEMLDKCQCILANSLEENLKDLENFAMYEALSEWNEEHTMQEKMKWHKNEFNLTKEQEDEFNALCDKYPEKTLNDCWEHMSDDLQGRVRESIVDHLPDIYQTYIIDEYTFETLKDYGQFVYYNEDIDLHFWGVMHFGTAWSHVMGNVMPIDNKERYIKP